MSGGSYNYIYSKLSVECEGEMHDEEMNAMIKDLCDVLHDLEWWQSGDYSEDQYRETVSEFKKKWFSSQKETKMNKEGFIEKITQKLYGNIQLDRGEINTIISALRESNHCFQEPYYEVKYHDKYGNTETRIMEPVASRKVDMDGYSIQEDRFDLNFRRIIRGE